MIENRIPTATQTERRAKARMYVKPASVADVIDIGEMVDGLLTELGARARRKGMHVHVHRDDLVAALFGPADNKKETT